MFNNSGFGFDSQFFGGGGMGNNFGNHNLGFSGLGEDYNKFGNLGNFGGAFGSGGKYIKSISLMQLSVNGNISTTAKVLWSDGSSKIYKPGDPNIPDEVKKAAPDVFSGKYIRKIKI